MATVTGAEGSNDPVSSADCLAGSFAQGEAWVVELRGEIDVDIIAPAREEVSRILRDHPGPVVFDLSRVTFCDSSTLNLLLHARQRTAVALVSPTPPVARLLSVTGIDELLPAYDSAGAAVRALAAAGGRPDA